MSIEEECLKEYGHLIELFELAHCQPETPTITVTREFLLEAEKEFSSILETSIIGMVLALTDKIPNLNPGELMN